MEVRGPSFLPHTCQEKGSLLEKSPRDAYSIPKERWDSELYVLGLVGSPRRGGNTEILIDKALEGAASSGAATERVRLADLRINPCRGCEVCKVKGRCIQDDDMQQIYSKILEADGVLLGTPVYFYGPSAQTKCLLDRCYILYEQGALKGKKVAIIAPYMDADPGTPRHLFGMMEESFNALGMEFVARLGVCTPSKGDAGRNEASLKRAFSIGRLVAGIAGAGRLT